MNFIATEIKDCFIIEPSIYSDERGFFYELYREEKFNEFTNLNIHFVQDNLAKSNYGVVRGLHIQIFPFAQAKLLHVYMGTILDVVIDVRKNSQTYGKHISVELSSHNKRQLFVPIGFLHGYSVLSETALVGYKCDNYYNKEFESRINPTDQILNIDWKIPSEKIILSQKDQMAISFNEFVPVKLTI